MTADRGMVLIAAVYGALNLLLVLVAVPGAAAAFGADSDSWIGPARALLEHGTFSDPAAGGGPQTFRPPLYPLFLAGCLWLDGGTFHALVVVQVMLLFATGLLVRRIVEDLLAGYGNLALALAILNPSALGTAHLVQSDTLFAFLTTATIWALMAFAVRPKAALAIAAGGLLAFACLTRTTGQFLLYLLPVIFPLLAVAAGYGRDWGRHLAAGVGSLVLAFLIVLPWILHNQAAGEGFSLSTSRLKSEFLWDNVAYLEKYDRDIGLSEAEDWGRAERARLAADTPDWPTLSEPARFQRLIDHGVARFFSYPAPAFAEAFGWAWAQFFGIPGVSNLTNLLGLSEQTPFAVFRATAYDNYLAAGIEALKRASPWATAMTLLGFAYVVMLRGLGLIGVVAMIRRRLWAPILVIAGGLGYFTVIHLFVANSRYRLPVEAMLIILALYGLDSFRRRTATREPAIP